MLGRRVWAIALHLNPPKSRLCTILTRLVGRVTNISVCVCVCVCVQSFLAFVLVVFCQVISCLETFECLGSHFKSTSISTVKSPGWHKFVLQYADTTLSYHVCVCVCVRDLFSLLFLLSFARSFLVLKLSNVLEVILNRRLYLLLRVQVGTSLSYSTLTQPSAIMCVCVCVCDLFLLLFLLSFARSFLVLKLSNVLEVILNRRLYLLLSVQGWHKFVLQFADTTLSYHVCLCVCLCVYW